MTRTSNSRSTPDTSRTSASPSTLITNLGGTPVELHVTLYDGGGPVEDLQVSAGLVLSFGRSVSTPKLLLDAMAYGGTLWELHHGLADVPENKVRRFPLGLAADGSEDLSTSDIALTVFFDPARGWTAVAFGGTTKRYQLWGHLPVDLRAGVPLLLPDRVAFRVPSGFERDHVIVLEQDPAVCREQTERLRRQNLTSGTITIGGAIERENAGVGAAGHDADGVPFEHYQLSDNDLTLIVVAWEQYLRFNPPLPNPQISELRSQELKALFHPDQKPHDYLRSRINDAAKAELLSVANSGTPRQHLEFLHKVAMRNGLTYERAQRILADLPAQQREYLTAFGDDRSGVRTEADDL